MTNEELQKRIDKLSETFYKFVNKFTGELIEIKKFIAETPKTFNDGDFVTLDNRWVSIYKSDGAQKDWICDYCGGGLAGSKLNLFDGSTDHRRFDAIRLSTDEEKSFLLESMRKAGLGWNAEFKRIVTIE